MFKRGDKVLLDGSTNFVETRKWFDWHPAMDEFIKESSFTVVCRVTSLGVQKHKGYEITEGTKSWFFAKEDVKPIEREDPTKLFEGIDWRNFQ